MQVEYTYKKGDVTNLKDFHELFERLTKTTWAIRLHGIDYHINLVEKGWGFEFDNRKESLGRCSGSRKKIYVSKTMLEQNLGRAYDFEDTIRHEIAHAIEYIIAGSSSHGSRWRSIALQVGSNGERCSKADLKNNKSKYTLVCPNGHSQPSHRLLKKAFSCSKCSPTPDIRFLLKQIKNY